MTTREIIKKYLGVPYRHLGRDLTGTDCYGLVVLIYKDLGIELPDYEYTAKWYQEGRDYYIEHYHELWKKVPELVLFDCILFKNTSNVVNHIGLYLGENKFIHCYEDASVEVSDITGRFWNRQKYGYFRYKGRD